MYKAIAKFADLADGGRVYQIGDPYPREGFTASNERLQELSTDQNRRGVPLIEKVEVATKTRKRVKKDANRNM